MKNKSIKILIMLAALMMMVIGCSNKDGVNGQTVESQEKLKVYASFYPIYDLASRVGGDHVEVETIIPFGSDPHEYEPSMKSLVEIQKSDAVILNGLEFEPWIENIEGDLKSSGVEMLVLGDKVDPLEMHHEEDDHHDEHGHDDHRGHEHGAYDPHVWLDPVRGIKEAELIREMLSRLDPENAKDYEENYNDLKSELEAIDADFVEFLNENKEKNPPIIVSHDAFGYMGDRYGLNFLALSGVSHDDDASLKQIASTIDFIKENEIKYVYREELGNGKLGQLLSQETGVEVLTLYTINGMSQEDKVEKRDYVYKMKSNLENIKKAFE